MTAALETVIGLALLYLLFSLLVSALVEYVAALFRRRAAVLLQALTSMVSNPQALLDHQLLEGSKPDNKNPSYIAPGLFAQVALTSTDARLTPVIDFLKASPAIAALDGQSAAQQVASQRAVENWFNECMKRWEGVYTRWSQTVSLIITLILVPILNINTVTVAQALWADPALRASQIEMAKQYLDDADKQPTQVIPGKNVEQAQAALDALNLPLGWDMYRSAKPEWIQVLLSSLPGLLLSVLAISAGSRFWFDALNRLVNLRLTGTPPSTTGQP